MNKHKTRFNKWVDKVANEWQVLDKKRKQLFVFQFVGMFSKGKK